MDGLTVSNLNNILESGKTTDQLRKSQFKTKVLQESLGKKTESFSSTLKNAINSVDELQKQSDVMVQKLATGETKNIPEVLISVEKADIALKLMMQVRNKVIDAYQEIMKMQV